MQKLSHLNDMDINLYLLKFLIWAQECGSTSIIWLFCILISIRDYKKEYAPLYINQLISIQINYISSSL